MSEGLRKLNMGRTVPGMANVPELGGVGHVQPLPQVPEIPRRNECPFGADCRRCKIAIWQEGKLECSIKVLATSTLRGALTLKENK